MTSATTTRLPFEQWRLVNVLYRRGLLAGGRHPAAVMNAADAGPDDLKALFEIGLVDAFAEGTRIEAASTQRYIATYAPGNADLDRRVTLHLSADGGRWATTNPHNLLIHEIAERQRDSHGVPCRDVLRNTGIDQSVLHELWETGLAVLLWPDGTAVAEQPSLPPRSLAGTIRVRLTAKGRQLAGRH